MLPTLPRHDPDPSRRAAALAEARDDYRFRYDYHAIVAADGLPLREKADPRYWATVLEKNVELEINRLATKLPHVDREAIARDVRALFEALAPEELARTRHERARSGDRDARPLAEYTHLYATIPAPPIVSCWERDDIFAWQAVAGTNPYMLRRLSRRDARFPVTDAHYRQAVATGDTFDQALAEGRLYLADYAVLDGMPEGTTDGLRKYNFAPLALYAWQPQVRKLVPVAIQCGQTPGASTPVLTPQDGTSWRMARTCVTTAEGNYQGIISHFAVCHQVMEAVILSARRQLAPDHPLLVLLAPHFENTLITNDIAMTALIGPNGHMDRLQSPTLEASLALATRAIDGFRLLESAPRKDFAARGVDDVDALGDYPARDDSLLVWDATLPFVEAHVRLYYANDSDVATDTELAAWVDEMGARDGGRLNGLSRPRTVGEVVELVAQIVFRCTAYHASINYSSFPLFSFPPNVQTAAFAPGPHGDGRDSVEAWEAMIPPFGLAGEAFWLFHEISMRLNRIGHYPHGHFDDPRVAPILEAYQARLDDVERRIEGRNVTRPLAYEWQLPSRISRSIHV